MSKKNRPKTRDHLRSVPTGSQAPAPVRNNTFTVDDVDALNYDFRPHVDAFGVIPEPTTAAVERFRTVMFGSFPLTEEDGTVKIDGAALMAKLTENGANPEDRADEIVGELMAAVYDLCGGSPTADQIEALPYRHKQAFIGWLTGVFLSPEV